MKLKDIVNLGKVNQQAQEQKFQNEYKKKLLKWQIENEIAIQPILQPAIDKIQATIIFSKINNEQLNTFKQVLNKFNEIK